MADADAAMQGPLGFGVIGTGGIAADFCEALARSERCKVVNVVGSSAAKAEAFAGILLAAGDAKGAIRELDHVIKLAPNVAGYRLLLGDALMGARNYRGAAEVFASALEMISQDPRLSKRAPEIVIRTARAYALDQDFFRAAHLVDKYLANIKPDDPRAPLLSLIHI